MCQCKKRTNMRYVRTVLFLPNILFLMEKLWDQTSMRLTIWTRKTTKTMMEWKPEGHEDTLTQSTLFKNRVFIACKKERSKVLQLVSGEIEMKDFISAEMTSRNGALLQELVEYLADSFVNLPEEYSNFLKNISKAYAVSSLIQVQT